MNEFGNARRAWALVELVDFASRIGGRAHGGWSDSLRLERHAANVAIDGHYCSHVYVATFDAGEFNE